MRIINTTGPIFRPDVPAAFDVCKIIENEEVTCRVLFYGKNTHLDVPEVSEKAINDVFDKHLSDISRYKCEFYLLFTANPITGDQVWQYPVVVKGERFVDNAEPERLWNKSDELQILSDFLAFISDIESLADSLSLT